MSRYKSTLVISDKVRKHRKLKITEYPKIEFKDSDIIHVTRFDDSYMSLANEFYGDQSLWWIIARANRTFKGTIKFEPGTNLIIPTEIEEIIDRLDVLNKEFERPD